MTILITGGAGYVGSHVVQELVDLGEAVVVVDDLSGGSRAALPAAVPLIVGDCGDRDLVGALIDEHRVSAIVHLCGSTVVPDSVGDPLGCCRDNAMAARNLIEAAAGCGVRHFVFASSAAVYGNSGSGPLSEDAPGRPVSPHGWSKLIGESTLRELAAAHDLGCVILRNFNVAGADPKRRANLPGAHASSLIRRTIEAALGVRPAIEVYGTGYPTLDGTCTRDFVHVSDVARAYAAALAYLRAGGADATLNCGYGRGHSVLDVIDAAKRVCGRNFPVRYLGPRPGDAASLVADGRRIRTVLSWQPRFEDLDTIVTHALAWELRRLDRPQTAADAFLKVVVESGIPATELRKLMATFGSRSRPAPAAERNVSEAPSLPEGLGAPAPQSPPATGMPKLTIGMATFDDYDGVYFTLQAIRLHHPEILDEVEFIVVDNNPTGPCAQALMDIEKSMLNCRYIAKGEVSGIAARDWVFEAARGEFVLCIDCHILIENGALRRLLDYFEARPGTADLLQGPMIDDDLKGYSTHLRPEWHVGVYGARDADPAGADADLPPFEIPMQGLGLFACRRSAWPGFNPAFRGFGGEAGYIHEKVRQRGGRTLCLPFLRWMHRSSRPFGTAYASRWEDRVRNYLIGFRELGWDTAQVVDHFKGFLGEPVWSVLVERLGPDVVSPERAMGDLPC